MVDQAKVMMPTTRMMGPSTGIWEKARVVSWPPSVTLSMLMLGFFMMVVTSTRPVMRHTTTVSQKVPVEDTRACRTGLRVWAAEATRGAEPMPDSLENRPRATPKRRAMSRPWPTRPPATAPGVKARRRMAPMAGRSVSKLMPRMMMQPST